jgi:hypothetical protein
MASPRLAERVDQLERDIAELKTRMGSVPAKGTWREPIGMFRNDSVFQEIVEAGATIRREERASE